MTRVTGLTWDIKVRDRNHPNWKGWYGLVWVSCSYSGVSNSQPLLCKYIVHTCRFNWPGARLLHSVRQSFLHASIKWLSCLSFSQSPLQSRSHSFGVWKWGVPPKNGQVNRKHYDKTMKSQVITLFLDKPICWNWICIHQLACLPIFGWLSPELTVLQAAVQLKCSSLAVHIDLPS